MSIEEQIEVLYKELPYSKPCVGDNFLLYSFPKKEHAASSCVEIKNVIERLNLNLKVEWEANSPLFCKIVLIKGNEE